MLQPQSGALVSEHAYHMDVFTRLCGLCFTCSQPICCHAICCGGTCHAHRMGRHGLRNFREQREGWLPCYGIHWRASTDRFVEAARGDYPAQNWDCPMARRLMDGCAVEIQSFAASVAMTYPAQIATHEDDGCSCIKKPRRGSEAARRPGPDRGR